jgi:hypothetical protein
MTTLDKINKLNDDYKNGHLKVTHKEYLRQYNSLARKYKKEQRQQRGIKTLSEQVKEFGARVKKEHGFGGYYIYEGKNFTVKFNEASCETTWWEVNIDDDDVDPKVFNQFDEHNMFERKKDVVQELLLLDKYYNEKS